MLQLFKPESKVQKDRKIMRETDARMAKYSRRGLVLNLFAFAISLLLGEFYDKAEGLAIILAAGLLLLTFWRGYYLFRFDALYPRAPARWRNRYFVASFIGAIWWSGILVSLTLKLGMEAETPILWLYTVIFLSSISNVFAPYRQFLSYYLFLVQLPPAIAALFIGSVEGYLYAAMMVVLFLTLSHQGHITCRTYWERLEANYALKQKARDLEEENLDSQAANDLKNEFLTNLGHEFRTSLSDVLGALQLLKDSAVSDRQQELLAMAEKASERQLGLVNNVMDYSRIAAKELALDIAVFNLRRQLEKLIEELAPEAHQQGVELNYVFDRDLPVRIKGDAARLREIILNLVSHAIHFSEQGEVLLEVHFNRETEDSGELLVIISDQGQGGTLGDQKEIMNPYAKVTTTKAGTGIGLAICKALAECMDGSVRVTSEEGEGNKFYLSLKFQVSGKQVQPLSVNPRLQGRRILLLDAPTPIEGAMIEELESWGMAVEMVKGGEQARSRLKHARDEGRPFDILLMYMPLQNLKLLDFSQELAAAEELEGLKQIVAMSQLQQLSEEVVALLKKSTSDIAIIDKPVIRQRLHETINKQLFDISVDASEQSTESKSGKVGAGQHILLVEDHRVNQMVAQGMLKKLGYSVTLASNGKEALEVMSQEAFDLILMDCQMPEMDGYMATQEIRNREAESEEQQHIPIVAMTAHAAEGDQTRCLAAGMDDYLAKPVRYEDLDNRLQRWLGANALSTGED